MPRVLSLADRGYLDATTFSANLAVTSGCRRTCTWYCADRLDVARQLDAAPVQVGAAGGLDRLLHLGRGDRAEQAAAGAGPRRQRDLQRLELRLDLVGVAQVADLPGRPGPLDRA